MTPPKIKGLKLDLGTLHLSDPKKLVFFPEYNLEKPTLTPEAHFNEGKILHLKEPLLAWHPPRLWKESDFLIAQSPPPHITVLQAPAKKNEGWSGAQIFQFVTDVLLLIETLDAKGTNMISNGGEGGCRYEEMARRSEVSKLLEKCLVKFEPNTHASVNLQLRKMENSNDSLITLFRVRYDKNIYKDEFPDNQVRVQGFQFTPTPQKPIPFDLAISPLTQMGYSIRYMVEPAGLMSIPFLGYPIFKIEAEPHPKLDLTKDFFLALGIDKPEYYTELNTEPFKAPQTVRGFMKLMDHIEGDDSKLQVVNINKLKGRPPLFDWLSFEKIDWISRLREGTLNFPDFGSFTFSRKTAYEKIAQTNDPQAKINILDHTARLEIHGTQAKLDISLENIELGDAQFKVGDQLVTLKGMRAGKIKTNIPGIKELIRQVKAGIFGLDKLHLEAEDLFVEEIVIQDNKNEIRTHLKNAQLNKFIFNGSSDITALGLRSQSMEVESQKLNMGFKIENAKIPETHFTRRNGSEELSMPRIEGGKTRIRYSNTILKANESLFEGLKWIEKSGNSQLIIQSLNSSGSISYESPLGIAFETSGSSKIQNINLGYSNTGDLTASLDITGKINQLTLHQGGSFQLNLSKAEFNPSHLSFALHLNPESKDIESVRYRCDLKIKNTEFAQSQLGPVILAPSKLNEGEIIINQESNNPLSLPSIEIGGLLDLHLQSINGNNESFNIPGLSVTGGIYDIALQGPAHFKTTNTGWLFEKLVSANSEKLSAKAKVKDVNISHDPHQVPGNTLQLWPHHEVVNSNMQIQIAELAVEDIGRIEFVNGNTESKTNNHLQNMLLQGIRIENIQASGVAWAKFPLFYYMRGVFPQIGARQGDMSLQPSYLSLDLFSIARSPQSSPITTLQGLRAEIYEVGGNEKFAKVNIPLLKISPGGENLIDTGNQNNEIELYLIDKARGGYIRLNSVPRPLEHRNSRIVNPTTPTPAKQ